MSEHVRIIGGVGVLTRYRQQVEKDRKEWELKQKRELENVKITPGTPNGNTGKIYEIRINCTKTKLPDGRIARNPRLYRKEFDRWWKEDINNWENVLYRDNARLLREMEVLPNQSEPVDRTTGIPVETAGADLIVTPEVLILLASVPEIRQEFIHLRAERVTITVTTAGVEIARAIRMHGRQERAV